MKKGYTSHRNLEAEIRIDLGELGEVIKNLPEDSQIRRKMEIVKRQILEDVQSSISYELIDQGGEGLRPLLFFMEMNALTAVWIAEGEIEADQDKQIEAWQYLVDTGLAWHLQGSIGRTADQLIEQEIITAP